MDIAAAQRVMLATHIAALKHETRANGLYLESGPGIGKSDGTFQYAEALARATNQPIGVVQFMLATISSVDVRGFMLPVKGNDGSLDAVFSNPPWFPTTKNTFVVDPDGTWHRPGTTTVVPKVGVLFLDEFAQAEDEVKKPAAELIYKGNVGTCELPVGWRVVAAGNRMSDRSGVMRELMFIVNRRCRLAIDASLPAWLDWAQKQPDANRPHYLTLSFAQKNPGVVFKDAVPEGTEPFCTPRTLCLLDKDLKALRSPQDEAKDTLPTDGLSREVAAGWIGGGSAGQFFTHLRYADQLPDIDDVVKDPMKAKCPDGRDVQMVASYMLAHHINDKTASPIMQYLTRLNVEMQVLAVKAANTEAARAKSLVSVPEYTKWLMKNKDLLIASQS
jgi:hypothetical protein